MRSILTLSLPPDILAALKRKAKSAGMNVSAFVRSLIEREGQLISEEELMAMSRKARRDYRAGKLKVLTSFDDLDQ